jgi:mersacidin/lichenicidin family type 2 lantibiotic
MLRDKIIQAWKDPFFRVNLSKEEQETLPENPAGAIELTDEELDMAAGGHNPSYRPSYSRSQSRSNSRSQSRSNSRSQSGSWSYRPSGSWRRSYSRSHSRSYSRRY